MRAFEHTLFAEREWLEVAKVRQVFEHVGDGKNVSRAHLVGKILEAVFPIVRGH